jgi:NAD(P)-dependent dehydrogenase (short-subunit alcohol dehydrogenase family)
MALGLEGKRIAVLGGGQGMGEASARLLTSHGAAVAVVDCIAERAERVSGDLARSGATAQPFVFDVLDDDALVAGVDRIGRDFGPLDGMVAIVGQAAFTPLVEMDAATWDLDHRRNLRYVFVAAREVARSLLARKAPGSMVFIASVDGLRSAPSHASYGAAKAGLVSLAKSMAVEWSGDGIRVNVVAPGGTVTPRMPYTDAANEARMMSGVPMHRRGTVEDIAKAVTFFLSDMSPYVTGQTLAVDGGFMAANVFALGQYAKPG